MELHEYPFYGLGVIAFAMAQSDGVVQHRERRELMSIVKEWSDRHEVDFDVAEIIFSLLSKNKTNEVLTYDKGMDYIRKGKQSLSAQMIEKFIFLINDVAHAFPPVTNEERILLDKFTHDMKNL